MKCHSYNMFFETVSNRLRIAILDVLRQKPMSVSEICKAVGEEQSKVSHSLKKMMECHIVEAKQKGKQRIYSLNKETVIPMLELVEKHVKRHCRGVCPRQK